VVTSSGNQSLTFPPANRGLISSVEASRHVFGLTSPPQSLPIPSVAPPDTHRRLKVNLRCVSGGAREEIRCGVGEIECASASANGAGTSGFESHEGGDWYEIGNGGSRLIQERGPKDDNSSHVCKHLWLRALLLM